MTDSGPDDLHKVVALWLLAHPELTQKIAVNPSPMPTGPSLFQIQEVVGKGRGLVAGTNVAEAQAIYRERPLLHCLLDQRSPEHFEKTLALTVPKLKPKAKAEFYMSLTATFGDFKNQRDAS